MLCNAFLCNTTQLSHPIAHFVHTNCTSASNAATELCECVVFCNPPQLPFVCPYHCVSSATGAAHISPAHPVIKLKVSSINHARPLSSYPPLSFLQRHNEGFVNHRPVAGEGGGGRGLNMCTRYEELSCFSTPASTPPLSQRSQQELQFPKVPWQRQV